MMSELICFEVGVVIGLATALLIFWWACKDDYDKFYGEYKG